MRQGSPRRPLPVWIVMFPDVQALDVTGPLEVFALANRLSPGRAPRYQISVLARGGGGGLDLERAVLAGRPRHPPGHRAGRHAPGRGGAGDAGGHAGRPPRVLDPAHRAARAARGVGLQRRLPAGRGRPARRPPRHHPLGGVRRAPAPLPDRARGGRSHLRPRRQGLHVGRRHRGHGPGPRAGGGGRRARPGPRGGPLAGDVPAPAGRAVAVQRPAPGPGGRAARAARSPGLDRTITWATTCRCPRWRVAPA